MQNVVLLTFYSVITSTVLGEAPDWCSLDCVDPITKEVYKNSMCIYESKTETEYCHDIKPTNTDEKRKKLLHLHNKFRNELAGGQKKGWPPAANMQQMEWDNNLEAVALRWAEQCKVGHDECRRTPEFKDVGQNYGTVSNSASYPNNEEYSFNSWVNELNEADPFLVDYFQSGFWAHFTQVAWAETRLVGCAMVQFKQDWFNSVLICNYAPSGNWLDQQMYQKGDPCTNCPEEQKCIPESPYPYLCAEPGQTEGIPVGDITTAENIKATEKSNIGENRYTEENTSTEENSGKGENSYTGENNDTREKITTEGTLDDGGRAIESENAIHSKSKPGQGGKSASSNPICLDTILLVSALFIEK